MSKTDELVLLWKRKDGLRCVALKRAPTRPHDTKLWELRVVRLSRVIKREAFEGFRAHHYASTGRRYPIRLCLVGHVDHPRTAFLV